MKILNASLFCLLLTACGFSKQESELEYFVTSPDQKKLLLRHTSSSEAREDSSAFVIQVDERQKYQVVEGFGYTLTGGSAWLIRQKLTDDKRKALLQQLFSVKDGIGLQWLRISIGASDLSAFPFTYQDKPDAAFDLGPDKEDLVPLLQEIRKINPDIRLLATPWSPPLWMKTNNAYVGGSLLKSHYSTYSTYLLNYIRAMEAAGLPVYALTPQNEPENPHNNPSLLMTAEEQAEFIGEYLGPQLHKAGLGTKIITYDHNCDHPEYPITVLSNEKARPYVDGSAFHLYAGDISALSKVHDAFPEKNIYFTEQWTSSEGNFGGDLQWHIRNVIVGSLRNWGKVAMEWNLANDKNMGPHTEGGCDKCLGALTIDENKAVFNVPFYIIAHASGWITPGSVRISSNEHADFPNVTVLRPDGKKVMVLMNSKNTDQAFMIKEEIKKHSFSLSAGEVATLIWN